MNHYLFQKLKALLEDDHILFKLLYYYLLHFK